MILDRHVCLLAASAPYTRQTDARGTSDLRETLKDLQYETKKGEIEDMIWEVDEGLNNTVSYIEFNIMYCRIRQTGGKTLKSVTQSRSLFLVLYGVV